MKWVSWFIKYPMVPVIIALMMYFLGSTLTSALGPTFGQWTATAIVIIFGTIAMWLWYRTTKKKDRS